MMSKRKFIEYMLMAFGGGVVVGMISASYILLSMTNNLSP